MRRARERRGLTQEALAVGAGIARESVARIEAGEVNATLRTVGRLAKALGVKPRELL